MSVTVQNQPLLIGNQVIDNMLKRGTDHARAVKNLFKVAFIPSRVCPITAHSLIRNTTLPHKRKQQINWPK